MKRSAAGTKNCGVLAILLLLSTPAAAEETVTLQLSLKGQKFEPSEIKAPAGKTITLKIKNEDSTPEEFESSSLRVEKVVAGNGEITVRIKPQKPGRHEFFGEYHQETARGVLIVE